MKKNKMMRTAAVLGVAALLTTSALSGTLAKYTTSVNSEDSARVATWGFTESSINITDLFKTSYDKNVNGYSDVIAPGTTNSVNFTFKYDGAQTAPEVAYDFTVSTDGSTCAEAIKTNPNIVWSLDGKTEGTWDNLLNSIKALSGDESGTKQYAAQELPTQFTADDETHTVSWKWKFETENTDEAAKKTQDEKDTTLGNKDNLDEVKLVITITATQVD